MAEWTPIIIGLMGVSGLIFTALRYRRDDSSALIQQQSTVLSDIRTINEELRLALADCEKRAGVIRSR